MDNREGFWSGVLQVALGVILGGLVLFVLLNAWAGYLVGQAIDQFKLQ